MQEREEEKDREDAIAEAQRQEEREAQWEGGAQEALVEQIRREEANDIRKAMEQSVKTFELDRQKRGSLMQKMRRKAVDNALRVRGDDDCQPGAMAHQMERLRPDKVPWTHPRVRKDHVQMGEWPHIYTPQRVWCPHISTRNGGGSSQ